MLNRISECLEHIRRKTSMTPRIGVILGTGLGDFVQEIVAEQSIHYAELPHFPVSTVAGHQGRLIFGHINQQPVVAMQGRFHFYEGYSMADVTFPIRVMKALGVEILILSNASGGVNPGFSVGDLMIITDHINLMGTNPLLGPNDERLGPRFPDMSEAYDHDLVRLALGVAQEQGQEVRTGVYAAVTGPVYETPSEYRFIRVIGADAVGMSTVPETIVARHMGIKVFAISVITDLGIEGRIEKITHEEVIRAARAAEPRLARLVLGFIGRCTKT
ncbi:MAG TPA: purine-nucleoside phosphorylase [Bacteroidales bacterium]|nr:purine-nucleoside phosphorylase [Bacteroidales bacterium]